MCGRSIRALTGDERAARDAAYGMRYDTLFAEIEAQERADYDAEFGLAFRTLYPFEPDGARVHQKVLAQLEQERNEQF